MTRAATAGSALGIAVVVGRDGSVPWRTARVAVIGMIGAALLVALPRLSAPRRGVVAFSAGVVAFAVGIAIGLPHLAKTGLTSMTVAGLVVLAGGLALVLSGATTVVRATPRWRRLLVVPALLVAVVVVVYSLGPAVAATNVPRTEVGSSTPADRGVAYRDIDFPASDGVALSGWYIPSENGAAVVLLHGSGSTRSSVLDHAVVLARHGYGVLLYDARGHGRSDGRAMDFGWYGDEDIAGATAFLSDQSDVDADRIAAVGMSMGGEQAIGAAATNTNIRAVVAEGATNRVASDRAWLSDEFGIRGAIQERLHWLTYGLADLLAAADPPTALDDAVEMAAPRPVLLIAAGSVPDESRAASYFQGSSPDTVDLWVVPDAGHTGGLDTAAQEWEQRVTAFLDEALGARTEGDRP